MWVSIQNCVGRMYLSAKNAAGKVQRGGEFRTSHLNGEAIHGGRTQQNLHRNCTAGRVARAIACRAAAPRIRPCRMRLLALLGTLSGNRRYSKPVQEHPPADPG